MDEETKSILNICDYIFVPMELGKFSVEGLTNVQKEISQSTAKFGGAFICKYNKKTQGIKDMLEWAKESYQKQLLNTIIPSSFAIQNSLNYDLTASEYMNNTSTMKYADLAEEVLEIIQKEKNNG
jgi:cellulose biosynthesis protein BcsQ